MPSRSTLTVSLNWRSRKALRPLCPPWRRSGVTSRVPSCSRRWKPRLVMRSSHRSLIMRVLVGGREYQDVLDARRAKLAGVVVDYKHRHKDAPRLLNGACKMLAKVSRRKAFPP